MLHAPPVLVSVKAVVLPAQTVAVPIIGEGVEGSGLTVTTAVAAELPQLLVTV